MKKFLRITLCIVVVFVIYIAIFWGSFIYNTRYKVTTRDTSVSPNGGHELLLQAVGEAEFPFGPADGRLVLKEGENTVVEADFVLHDDGASIRSDSWKVTWHEDNAEVILSGKEQYDDQVILYFDGRKEWTQLAGVKSRRN